MQARALQARPNFRTWQDSDIWDAYGRGDKRLLSYSVRLLITMLIWIYYAAQIVLFGAEFTRVYAQERGRGVRPGKHAVRVDRKEIELAPLTDRGDKRV